ncbi:hypothetical protein OOK41_25345 [Micromonospora sp. NBC_01655]|uniref:hypothetical protein n=1 Tax=Micromonospora sp. NBC_01655 TaxID=2975983 RepID=UPI0022517C04|nr:hypothetical protein [Micromonospora sp. NBC_01655]MCX4473592.1 hypothetical protein [Micromonospora sp. NBC_01655]
MSPFASRPRRRPALLLILGLVLGLAAPTVVAAPASAGPSALARPFCTSSGFFEPNPADPSIATTYTLIGIRNNEGFAYRYWMVQAGTSSKPYYQSSLVAKCNGVSLVSSTTLTTTSASGTIHCTSSSDISSPFQVYTERYVGQRQVPTQGGVFPTAMIRYWHREQLPLGTAIWIYHSSYVVRC